MLDAIALGPERWVLLGSRLLYDAGCGQAL
jgi:hypothetical protein